MQKRSAGSSEPNALNFFDSPAPHALMDSIVLAIDGQQRLVLPASFGGNQFACGHQTLFVGQAYAFTCFDRFIRGF